MSSCPIDDDAMSENTMVTKHDSLETGRGHLPGYGPASVTFIITNVLRAHLMVNFYVAICLCKGTFSFFFMTERSRGMRVRVVHCFPVFASFLPFAHFILL